MCRWTFFSLLLLALSPLRAAAAEPFELRDGDRVVFLGSTIIEREQRYGYWETALTKQWPDRNITFRNIGWSGDTVWGEARAAFDTSKEGYQRLVQLTLSLKPTVIFICYGTNESFDGVTGLPRFRTQYNKLISDLAPTRARIVLMAPPMFEEEKWRAGAFEKCRRDLEAYTGAIRQIADANRALFLDELCYRYGTPTWTDDGMHLTTLGYYRTSANLLNALHVPNPESNKRVELDGLNLQRLVQTVLPNSPVPRTDSGWVGDLHSEVSICATGLKAGKFWLQIDGKRVHTTDVISWANATPEARGRLLRKPSAGQDAETWMYCSPPIVIVTEGPALDQAEKLRQTIVEKNRLFFHRYRPENETYLFGFRKQEQGQNAKEVPQFDPLIERLEKEIARLRKPVAHTYQLVPAEK